MPDLVPAVLLVAGLGSARWLLRELRTVPHAGGLPGWARSVSVVVPARDEAATLPALLGSLQHLEVGVGEVIVVDDGSRDATAAVARSFGATVVAASDPPPGWTGKAWACHLGAQAASGERLLFLDADTTLAPDSLGGLLGLLERHGGLVSVQPFHHVVQPYEQLSAYFNVVPLLASAAFAARAPRRPMAFGPCLLTSRADYDRAGGHGAVRGEILDDVQLAAVYDRAGIAVHCFAGGRSVRMRSYPDGLAQLAAGWTKNVAAGASAATPGPLLGAVLWACAHHVVAVGACVALVEAATGRGSTGTHLLWALAWVGVAGQLRAILRRTGSFRWWAWALFPAPLLAFDLLFAVSAVLTLGRRSVRWRGRVVHLDAHRVAGRDA